MQALTLRVDSHAIVVTISTSLVLVVLLASLIVSALTRRRGLGSSAFEIDEAEIGVGDQKIKLKPNREDLQIAYRLWVEISTRKIGLPIDLEHDVISQLYDSWYDFFKVTRGLLKDVPASKLRGTASTQKLITIAINVLNDALRPHLTSHQARFRRWLDWELAKPDNAEVDPQTIQQRYPQYSALTQDLLRVNRKLMRYRAILRHLVFGTGPVPAELA